MKRNRQRGQSLVEFTFVGIPLMFVLISIFEVSRGMWMYQTLAYSVREGVRFASVRGIDCVPTATNLNNCQAAIKDIAGVIQFYGVGLDLATTQATFTVCSADDCSTPSDGTSVVCMLGTTCASNNTYWPPNDNTSNRVGVTIRIDLVTPFKSGLAMLWPGAGKVSFALVNLPAGASETIKF
jgi:Flp pilus assembly protein TadG